MAKELVMVNENWTVLTCLREVSRQAENLDEIYNIYVVDDDNKLKGRLSLKKIITAHGSTDEIKAAALAQGMHTLRMSAAQYVLEGVTTIEEMLKVSFED